MSGRRSPRWVTEPAYTLEVSRGYVRLVRTGGARPRSSIGRHFTFMDGSWSETDVNVMSASEREEIRRSLEAQAWALASAAPISAELDPDVQDAIEEAMRYRCGAMGQSHRSRNNLRRMIVFLPWELQGRVRG